jgi:hypothetical protein
MSGVHGKGKKKDLQCDLQVFFVAQTFLHSIDCGNKRITPILDSLLEFSFYPQPFTLKIGYFPRDLKLRTRVAVAQRIEHSTDCGEGCGFESHQSHASSEALGFSHLEPLSQFMFPRFARSTSPIAIYADF